MLREAALLHFQLRLLFMAFLTYFITVHYDYCHINLCHVDLLLDSSVGSSQLLL